MQPDAVTPTNQTKNQQPCNHNNTPAAINTHTYREHTTNTKSNAPRPHTHTHPKSTPGHTNCETCNRIRHTNQHRPNNIHKLDSSTADPNTHSRDRHDPSPQRPCPPSNADRDSQRSNPHTLPHPQQPTPTRDSDKPRTLFPSSAYPSYPATDRTHVRPRDNPEANRPTPNNVAYTTTPHPAHRTPGVTVDPQTHPHANNPKTTVYPRRRQIRNSTCQPVNRRQGHPNDNNSSRKPQRSHTTSPTHPPAVNRVDMPQSKKKASQTNHTPVNNDADMEHDTPLPDSRRKDSPDREHPFPLREGYGSLFAGKKQKTTIGEPSEQDMEPENAPEDDPAVTNEGEGNQDDENPSRERTDLGNNERTDLGYNLPNDQISQEVLDAFEALPANPTQILTREHLEQLADALQLSIHDAIYWDNYLSARGFKTNKIVDGARFFEIQNCKIYPDLEVVAGTGLQFVTHTGLLSMFSEDVSAFRLMKEGPQIIIKSEHPTDTSPSKARDLITEALSRANIKHKPIELTKENEEAPAKAKEGMWYFRAQVETEHPLEAISLYFQNTPLTYLHKHKGSTHQEPTYYQVIKVGKKQEMRYDLKDNFRVWFKSMQGIGLSGEKIHKRWVDDISTDFKLPLKFEPTLEFAETLHQLFMREIIKVEKSQYNRQTKLYYDSPENNWGYIYFAHCWGREEILERHNGEGNEFRMGGLTLQLQPPLGASYATTSDPTRPPLDNAIRLQGVQGLQESAIKTALMKSMPPGGSFVPQGNSGQDILCFFDDDRKQPTAWTVLDTRDTAIALCASLGIATKSGKATIRGGLQDTNRHPPLEKQFSFRRSRPSTALLRGSHSSQRGQPANIPETGW